MRTHDKAKFHDRKIRVRIVNLFKTSFKPKTDLSYTSNPHQWANKMEIMRQVSC